MSRQTHKLSLLGSLMELRAPIEALSLIPTLPLLRLAPKGDQHPVVVIPGFLATDNSTYLLRRYLTSQNLKALPWEMGRNPGLQEKIYNRIEQRIISVSDRYEEKVSLVGWSLGGIYSRLLAHNMPDRIRQVVTIGSPFNLESPHSTEHVDVSEPILRIYEKLNPGLDNDKLVNGEPIWEQAPPVPSTAIYSHSDGIAAWDCCIDKTGDTQTENLRLLSSHTGMTHNPLVFYALAERLSQPEGEWKRFDTARIHRFLFPKSFRHSDIPCPA